jgi:hypothetical protein
LVVEKSGRLHGPGKTTLTLSTEKLSVALELFKELLCTFIGHDLEPQGDREDGKLPKFECSRCGREVKRF